MNTTLHATVEWYGDILQAATLGLMGNNPEKLVLAFFFSQKTK